MAMHRDEVIETLAGLAAPLGPFTTHDERLQRQDRWVDAGGVELLEALVDLIASPPAEDRLGATNVEDWTSVLVEVAGTLGARHPDVALRHLLPLLDHERSRGAAIDVLGAAGDARAVPELERLVRGGQLGTDDLVHVAGALGEIGGEHACRLLEQMRAAVPPDQDELLEEIEIALEIAGSEL
jgi:HEAT repeat protein